MKFIIRILILISFITISTTNAQLINSYGIKLGITSSDMSFDYKNLDHDRDTKRRIGFIVGGFVEWFNNPIFSLLTQIEYAQKGFEQEFIKTGEGSPDPIGTETYSDRLDYISIPIVAKIKVLSSGIVPYLLAGGRLDFLIGHDSEFENEVYDDFNSPVFGGTVGIGVQPNLNLPIKPFLEAKYNIDFTNSYDENVTIKNNSFDIVIGVTF